VIWIDLGRAGNPFKIADMDLKRYGIERHGRQHPAGHGRLQELPGHGGATYYFGIPKNPVNEAMVSMHYKQFKAPPDFFTAGGFRRHGHLSRRSRRPMATPRPTS
jgi:branched-chain amino acid transport system substrate-binding protein